MKSVVEKLSPTRAKVEVMVEYDDLKPYMDRIIKEAARQVQVPGFRSGKAPVRLVEQRIGRDYVINQAVSQGIDDFYREVLQEQELVILDAPDVEVKTIPQKEQEPFEFVFEADIRPEITLPDFGDISLTVSDAAVDDAAVGKALEELRVRFGTLKTVERSAADGDFVTIDLKAVLDGKDVDRAEDLSYQIGSGTMLSGMDEALTGLSAGESKTFGTKLEGGEHSGEEAEVSVTLKAVKERELPDVDDEFAQMASEFETVTELKDDLQEKAERAARVEQGVEARDALADKLVREVEVELPEAFIDKQVDRNYTADGAKEQDTRDEFRAKVIEQFKRETILDTLADVRKVEVTQAEVMEYLTVISGQYGMDPNQFAAMLSQSGQLPSTIADIRRRKALAAILGEVKVRDKEGNAVDLDEFINPRATD